ncbi:hypothetical protein [Caldalkalibacillus mannanilyticus]|uniref:hypothetical protein n=1 Tax=Caldalkalibacillus mannanilyticus TaxID=1418 RepID=UPI00046920F3|nr:hypothetical protein [Caldalkalibacillus mannanilyticus]
MSYQFKYDERLGISIPIIEKGWEQYSIHEQEQILFEWEEFRSDIPSRIKELEKIITKKQEELSREENFALSCKLNDEISRLASTINDLNIWFRIQQDTQARSHH